MHDHTFLAVSESGHRSLLQTSTHAACLTQHTSYTTAAHDCLIAALPVLNPVCKRTRSPHLLDAAAQLLLQLLLLLADSLEGLDGTGVIGVLEQHLVHVLEFAAGIGVRMTPHMKCPAVGHSSSRYRATLLQQTQIFKAWLLLQHAAMLMPHQAKGSRTVLSDILDRMLNKCSLLAGLNTVDSQCA